jgi:membrane peptidoglycan carboxypeptidase
MDPNTGAVKAMVGGPGFEESQYNIATQPPGRQPGSTWKVITLAAALEAGYSPEDMVDGTSPCTVAAPGTGMYTTQNAEGGGGMLSLRAATEESVNCAFARLNASVGPAKAVDMAHRLGIAQDVPAFLSITLGTREATPLEMATVTSTLAAGGVRHDPVFVTRVTTPEGNVLLDAANAPGERVVGPDLAACETDMLRGVIANGTGTAARTDAHTAAGKTGTTDEKNRRLVRGLHAAARDGRVVRRLDGTGAGRGLRRPDARRDLEGVHGLPARRQARCSVRAAGRSLRRARRADHAGRARTAAAATCSSPSGCVARTAAGAASGAGPE